MMTETVPEGFSFVTYAKLPLGVMAIPTRLEPTDEIVAATELVDVLMTETVPDESFAT